ncbi:leucine-rich repeat flightless-interacting protein 2-like isoform X2 [Amphiura filiformis]|uniref:leucine-rich repeat flightless-interacting protein 2-like isoform X2 n=1 Tax=Amphiura filiformis TaxID=82378 RepID=UPI003B213325
MSSAAAAAAAMSMTSPTSTTPGGRKRTTTPTYKSEEQALDQIAKEAEERLAARRKAREEARKIRMYELERQQKEAEEQMDKEFIMKAEEKKNLIKHASVTGTSYTGGSTTTSVPSFTPHEHRRGSADSAEQESLKDQLIDLQEKYKKAMMTNAQLDNEKATLTFEVDALKDTLEEQEEVMMELQRETRDKHRELEGKKRENAVIKKDIGTLKEMVSQRDQLISEHGLLVVGDEDENDLPEGQRSNKRNKVGQIVVVSPEAAELLDVGGDGPLDVRLKHFVEEKKTLLEEIRTLRIELEDERSRIATAERRRHVAAPLPAENGPDLHEMLDTQKKGQTAEQMRENNAKESLVVKNSSHGKHKKDSGHHHHHHHDDFEREMGRQIQEYKFKLQRTEQEVTTLEGNVLRLEGQVKRYRASSEEAEANEEELKAERRKIMRENRTLKDKVEEMETENGHLMKRLEKLKSSRLTVK